MSEIGATLVTVEEKETPCRPKTIRQRRSTVLRRRSTLQAPVSDENRSQNACEKQETDKGMLNRIGNADSDNCENRNGLAQFDLQKYIDDLKEEKKTWKQTLLDRKRQHKSILKQKSNMRRGEQDLDLSALSETERNFLLVRPNYEHICEKTKKLTVMATEISILNEHVMHLHKRCISRAEKKLDDLTKRIIRMVD